MMKRQNTELFCLENEAYVVLSYPTNQATTHISVVTLMTTVNVIVHYLVYGSL